jgi:hypothetical protein
MMSQKIYTTPDYMRRAIQKYHLKNKDKIALSSKKRIYLNRVMFILNQADLTDKDKLACIFKSRNYPLFKEDAEFIFLIHDSGIISNSLITSVIQSDKQCTA